MPSRCGVFLIRPMRGIESFAATCLLVLALLFTGASQGAGLELDEYLQRATAAKTRGDWESVASQVAQAINHSDLPKAGALRSDVHLEYGRAMGVLCQYDEAEKYLLLARDIAARAGISTFPALYELGASSAAQKKFAAAADYFLQLLPFIERESRIRTMPLLVADAYEKLATALAATGKPDEAETRRREAAKIREAGAKPVPGLITPYGAMCPKS